LSSDGENTKRTVAGALEEIGDEQMQKQLKADIALLTVVIIWGSTFVLIKDAIQHIQTYNFLSLRFGIAAIFLALFSYKKLPGLDRVTLRNGVILGLMLFGGYAFQTVGLNYTTASNAAFIVGFSAVIVPVISAMYLKKWPQPAAVLGVLLAMSGLGLLTLGDSFALNIGDVYSFMCTFFFALQIIFIDRYTRLSDPMLLATVEVGTVAAASVLFTFILEQPIIPYRPNVWLALLVTSLLATTYAFLVQNVAQKYTSPTHTALIFIGEPVFALAFAFILLGELLTFRQFTGCALILAGMIAAEFKSMGTRKRSGIATHSAGIKKTGAN
jgi:drug/metabolite transporter (DMT)-like permease